MLAPERASKTLHLMNLNQWKMPFSLPHEALNQ